MADRLAVIVNSADVVAHLDGGGSPLTEQLSTLTRNTERRNFPEIRYDLEPAEITELFKRNATVDVLAHCRIIATSKTLSFLARRRRQILRLN